MKRRITLLCLLLGAIMPTMAQTFEFRFGGQSLKDDETVTIAAEPDSFFPDEKGCKTNPVSNPDNGLVLAVLDGSKKSGNATMEIISNTLSPNMIQWCMGGVCELMTNKTSLEKTFETSAEGLTKVEFDATKVGDEGKLEARLTAKIGEETKTVNILFVPESGTTSIDHVLQTEAGDGPAYGLNGNRLKSPGKGLIIQKGRKLIALPR